MNTAIVVLTILVVLIVFNPDPNKLPKRRTIWNGFRTSPTA